MHSYPNTLGIIASSAAMAIQSIDPDELKKPIAPNKWSKIEILGHLVDSAYNNHRRLVQARYQSNLIFDGYDQNSWVEANGYHRQHPSSVASTFLAVNMHLATLVEMFPGSKLTQKTTEHNFDKICMYPINSQEEISLDYLVWDYIAHMEHHLAQIIPEYTPRHKPYEPQT